MVAAAERQPQAGLAVVGDVDVEALGPQAALQGLREPHLVVDDQHPHGPASHPDRAVARGSSREPAQAPSAGQALEAAAD